MISLSFHNPSAKQVNDLSKLPSKNVWYIGHTKLIVITSILVTSALVIGISH